MGFYLNPGYSGFKKALNGKYVDKTGLIRLINDVIDTPDQLTCVSRPRRFGKTFAAQMLCAYYSKNCDSHSIFEGLEISKDASFEKHLNQYDVIFLDITWFINESENSETIISNIQDWVIQELKGVYPGCIADTTTSLTQALVEIFQSTGNRFFFIIDEWDALFREAKYDSTLQKNYLQFLRGLFKSPATMQTIVGAYMTGILPIKKYGTESALTDFREYTMVNPNKFASYVGFTETEVRKLCKQYHMDFDLMEQWYNGYSFSRIKHVYCPNSVMGAIREEEFNTYWTKTETYESLKNYISDDKYGLKEAIITMLGGIHIEIDTSSFLNDFVSLNSRDDILTLLVHLGYLAYNNTTHEVWIPNLEVMDSFKTAIKNTGWKEVENMLEQSKRRSVTNHTP